VLKDRELEKSLQQQGFVLSYGDARRLAEITAQDVDKWGRVVKTAGIVV